MNKLVTGLFIVVQVIWTTAMVVIAAYGVLLFCRMIGMEVRDIRKRGFLANQV